MYQNEQPNYVMYMYYAICLIIIVALLYCARSIYMNVSCPSVFEFTKCLLCKRKY